MSAAWIAEWLRDMRELDARLWLGRSIAAPAPYRMAQPPYFWLGAEAERC